MIAKPQNCCIRCWEKTGIRYRDSIQTDLTVKADKILFEMKVWPVTIMADASAGDQILKCFGKTSPNIRCVTYATDRSLKVNNSTTENISEIFEFVPRFFSDYTSALRTKWETS